jgi:NTE family protein
LALIGASSPLEIIDNQNDCGLLEWNSGKIMLVGLALGGGAARGMAHIGVLDVLAKAQIPIYCLSGCSVGGVVGALYCAGYTTDEIRCVAHHIHWRRIARKAKSISQGLLSFERLERLLVMMIGDIDFSELKVPFSVAAMDFETGERVVLKSGSVAKAVHASCSIPGFVTPVDIDGQLLVDGGIVDNLPVDLARDLGADYVVGVDIFMPNYRRGHGLFGTGLTTIETLIRNAGGGVSRADFLIKPDTAGKTYTRFSQHRELISEGEQSTRACLPELINDLRMNGLII